MDLRIKILFEEDKNELKLNVFAWSQIENQSKPNDLSSLVANFKVPLKLIPPGKTTSPHFVSNKSSKDADSKMVEPGEDPQILQPNGTGKQNEIEDQLEDSFNQQSDTENNDDPDASMNDLPEFIDYMNEKHEEIISSRKNSHKLCKCGASSANESESSANPMRSNGLREKYKVDTVEIQNEPPCNEDQSNGDQLKYENGIQPTIANGRRSPEMENAELLEINDERSPEMNGDEVDTASEHSDDYSLMIDEDLPKINISPVKKDINTRNLSKAVTSPKKSNKSVITSSPRLKNGPFWCRICKFSFNREASQKSHMSSYHGLKFTCEICDVQFVYRSQFMAHFRSHCTRKRMVEKNTKLSYACKHCGSQFGNTKSLLAHSEQHSVKKSTYSLWQNSSRLLNVHSRLPKRSTQK